MNISQRFNASIFQIIEQIDNGNEKNEIIQKFLEDFIVDNIIIEVGESTEILRILKKVISDLEEREGESTIDSAR